MRSPVDQNDIRRRAARGLAIMSIFLILFDFVALSFAVTRFPPPGNDTVVTLAVAIGVLFVILFASLRIYRKP